MSIPAGTRLGHYKVRSKLGAGGMGEVYLAEDTKLDRNVALKLLPAHATTNADSLRRFEQEARAASRLNHPSIAHIYEIGESEGVHFIAMEFVEGVSLDEKISGRPLPVSEIVQIGMQIADALGEAHSQGVVHRDIKPANVMITKRGRVKVLDFGLAKISKAVDSEESTRVKTNPGAVMGTVSYMSPEQALGRETDSRTDIWSLGVILYEMATGRLPFESESITETIDIITHAQPIAIARFNYDVPAELEVVIKKALRKKREERYQSARDVFLDLENMEREMSEPSAVADNITRRFEPLEKVSDVQLQPHAAAAGPDTAQQIHTTSNAEYIVSEIKRHKTGVIIALAVLFLAVGGLIGFGYGLYRLIRMSAEKTEPISKPAPTLKIRRLTGDGKTVRAVISPDGRFLAHARSEGGQLSLWVKQISTNSNVQIVAPGAMEDFYCLAFTPDGGYVYFSGIDKANPVGTIFRVPVLGGAISKIVSKAGVFSFSPDGRWLIFSSWRKGRTEIWRVPVEGGEEERLTDFHADEPAISPDGKHIACFYLIPRTDLWRIAIIPFEGGAPIRTFDAPLTLNQDKSPVWTPDGRGITYIDMRGGIGNLWVQPVDGGAPRQLTNYQQNGIWRREWTRDGKQVAIVRGEETFDAVMITDFR